MVSLDGGAGAPVLVASIGYGVVLLSGGEAGNRSGC